MKRGWIGVLLGALCGCGPAGIASGGSTTSTTEESSTEEPDTSSDELLNDDESSTGDGDGETDGGSTCELPSLTDCGVSQLECPEGQKCGNVRGEDCTGAAYGFDACVPVIGNQGVGEPCTVITEDLGLDPPTRWRLDDCDPTSSCRLYASNPDQGLCLSFCDWSEFVCEDPERVCLGGALPVCWQRCDPLAEPSCEGGFVCGPWQGGQKGVFHCGVPSPSSTGQFGDGCVSNIGCASGFACAQAEQLPDCDHDFGCCSPLCSLDELDPCAELGPAYTCVPYYNPGFEPPGLEHLGICTGL